MKQKRLWIVAWLLLGGTACQRANYELGTYDPDKGYRFDLIDPNEEKDSIFICLTFSGGGTRAAAFALGVLHGMQETRIPGDEAGRTLLDEVDLISATSGGAFTAMGYAKWGKKLFDPTRKNKFKSRFLNRDMLVEISRNLLSPSRILLAPSVLLGHNNGASLYYGRKIFGGMTYGDLIKTNRRPFVVVNATDVARRRRFEFTQDDFDILGADLASQPIGRAVAASSAFPIVFRPLRFPYCHGTPLNNVIKAVLADDRNESDRRSRWARSLLHEHVEGEGSETDDHHKYLYLLDGGLSDNLGLQYVIESYRSGAIRDRLDDGRIDSFVLIVVDAGTDSERDLESKYSLPNLFEIIECVAFTGIERLSAALKRTAEFEIGHSHGTPRYDLEQFSAIMQKRAAKGDDPETPGAKRVKQYVIDLNLGKIKDKSRSERLLSTQTSLSLPRERVEELIQAGRELVIEDPEFLRLLRDLATSSTHHGRIAPLPTNDEH